MTSFSRYRYAFIRRLVTVAAATPLVVAALPGTAHAATTTACLVDYQILQQGAGGFAADITLVNLGDPVAGWVLSWQMNPGEQLGAVWQADLTQSGTWVAADPGTAAAAYLPTGAQITFGWTASTPTATTVPTAFWFKGVLCQIAPAAS